MPPPRFSVRSISYTLLVDGFIIKVITDTPCHLFMRWTLENPRTHKDPELKRGAWFPERVRFCFVKYVDNEQIEAGDTLTHTFRKPDWAVCETRYFYFWGTVAGEFSPSESPLFEKHNEGYTMLTPNYFQIDNVYWIYWFMRYAAGETYLQCHNHPDATSFGGSDTRFCAQHYYGANNYRIDRYPMWFYTGAIPKEAMITGAFIQFQFEIVAGRTKDLYLFDAPFLSEPWPPSDYGAIGDLVADPILIIPAAAIKHTCWNTFKIPIDKLDKIARVGATKWALRTIDDINAAAPTQTMEGVYIRTDADHLAVNYVVPS